MNRFSISAFLFSATALATITPVKGENPHSTSTMAQELLDLKRQIKENNEKIRSLEAHFRTKSVKTPSAMARSPGFKAYCTILGTVLFQNT